MTKGNSNQANGTTPKANRNEQMAEKTSSGDVEQGSKKADAILDAIGSMKTQFSSRLDGGWRRKRT